MSNACIEDSISLEHINAASERIAPYITQTPTIKSVNSFFSHYLPDSEVWLKYELLQVSGTFKVRGVLNNLLAMGDLSRGVTAASAGNHAIAVADASSILGLDAKVVMQSSANPARIAAAKAAGAEIIIAEDGPAAFAMAHQLEQDEDRLFIHPFDGFKVAQATGGIAAEMLREVPDLDAIIVSVGGGGLAGGVAAGAKLISPNCEVLGVEPEGAAAMALSFDQGKASTLQNIDTIADSLAPPMTTEVTYRLCSDNMDALCTVSDQQMAAACFLLGRDHKVIAEPACGAATAAALTRFADRLANKKVGIILCGSNIDADSYSELMKQGEQSVQENIFRRA